MWRSKWYNYENTQNNNLDIIYVSSLLQFRISTKESYPKKDEISNIVWKINKSNNIYFWNWAIFFKYKSKRDRHFETFVLRCWSDNEKTNENLQKICIKNIITPNRKWQINVLKYFIDASTLNTFYKKFSLVIS